MAEEGSRPLGDLDRPLTAVKWEEPSDDGLTSRAADQREQQTSVESPVSSKPRWASSTVVVAGLAEEEFLPLCDPPLTGMKRETSDDGLTSETPDREQQTPVISPAPVNHLGKRSRGDVGERQPPGTKVLQVKAPANGTSTSGQEGSETAETNQRSIASNFLDIYPDILQHVLSFFLSRYQMDTECIKNNRLVSMRWRTLLDSTTIWKNTPLITEEGGLNKSAIANMGIKAEGTEGTCFRVKLRSTGKEYAMKRARVYPNGEGVPYYMLRELAVLQGMNAAHISTLRLVNLHKYKLHIFFDYIPHTLADFLNRTGDLNGGTPLKPHHTARLLFQLLDGVAYCHRRGVLHRNLKPKHLLIVPGPNPADPLEGSTLKLSDFALVRMTSFPRRTYTTEVVTLWYRPPEILMGLPRYSSAADMWSVGCIFAEMVRGRPIFTGISEIDQLFQIFSKLSTPSLDSWPEFTSLPYYNAPFPNWPESKLPRLFPDLTLEGLDLLQNLLNYNPAKRTTAEQAMQHPFFRCYGQVHEPLPLLHLPVAVADPFLQDKRRNLVVHLDHLRELEVSMPAFPSYISTQSAIREEHRFEMVDWLQEVVDMFEMSVRSVFLAVSHTDRFLQSRQDLPHNRHQLLGATCLHIASKCEDVSYIGIDDLANAADQGSVFKPVEVLEMEEAVLNELKFHLSVPTSLDFLHVLMALVPAFHGQTLAQNFCKYLAELSLLRYRLCCQVRPSVLAAAICVYGLHCLNVHSWPRELELLSGCKLADLRGVVELLHAEHGQATVLMSTVPTVRRKYRTPNLGGVANILGVDPAKIGWR